MRVNNALFFKSVELPKSNISSSANEKVKNSVFGSKFNVNHKRDLEKY